MTLREFFFSLFPSHSEVKKQDPSCSLNRSEEHAAYRGGVWGALKQWRSWPLQSIYGCRVPWVHVWHMLLAQRIWPFGRVGTSGSPVWVLLWGDAAAHVKSVGFASTDLWHLDPWAFPFRPGITLKCWKSPVMEFLHQCWHCDSDVAASFHIVVVEILLRN